MRGARKVRARQGGTRGARAPIAVDVDDSTADPSVVHRHFVPPRSRNTHPSDKPVKFLPTCPKCYALAKPAVYHRGGIPIIAWFCREMCGWWQRVRPGTPEAFTHAHWRRSNAAHVRKRVARVTRDARGEDIKAFVKTHKKISAKEKAQGFLDVATAYSGLQKQ